MTIGTKQILYTSLDEIKSFNPCALGWRDVLKGQGKTESDSVKFLLVDCVKSNLFADVCWLLAKRKKEIKIAITASKMCADSVKHINSKFVTAADADAVAAYAAATVAAADAAADAAAAAAYADAYADAAAAAVNAADYAAAAAYAVAAYAVAATAVAATAADYAVAAAYAAAARQKEKNKQFLILAIQKFEAGEI